MRQSPDLNPAKSPASQHFYWPLVQRVSSSTALRNSPRLLQLFRYLCGQALTAPDSFISEQQIGKDVFEREFGYNSEGDTIVRTQVSQLRKRLLQYFLSEGRDEPITIEIPVGSYLPVFQPRKELVRQPPHDHVEPAPPGRVPRLRAIPSGLWIAMAALIVLCGWLAWQNLRLREQRVVSVSAPGSPYLDHLWKQLFDNRRQTYIVTSDANAMFFSDFMDRPITLDQYRAEGYPNNLVDAHIGDPEARRMLAHFMNTYFTGSQDAFAVARLTETGKKNRIPATVVYARNFRWQTPEDNVILLGHLKANPWVEPFDSQLNFSYEWRPEVRKGILRNRHPKEGESASYQWNVPSNSTYATLSYVPTREGRVLIIGGTDMTAVDAGSRFLCDEEAVHKLHSALGIDLGQSLPHFEALVVARRARNVAYEPQLISVRILETQVVASQTHRH
jgi:hypothetical protein